MLLTINGNLNKYYLQTLCMLFFPGAKFSEKEEEVRQCASFWRRDNGNMAEVACTFECDGRSASALSRICPDDIHGFSLDGEGDGLDRAAKIAAGIAALDAGRQLFGSTPAWGILTGIRPAKLASELMREHNADGSRRYLVSEIRSILGNEFFVNPRKAALAVDIARSEQKVIRLARSGRHPTCSLYISIPFCPTRCSYCSFVSYATPKLLSLIPDYLERLLSDLRRTLSYISERGFRLLTVYIGGGTPTTLSEEQLDRLLSVINEGCDVSRLAEFTLEAGRPDTITPGKLACAAKHGVTRISINPQTLRDEILHGIGRRHTAGDFFRAYEAAREAGIPCINTDLIAGLPGDDFAGFSKTLDRIIGLSPDNVTVHTFCVKKSAEILRLDTEIYTRSATETVKAVDYSQVKLKNAGYIPYYIYRQKNTVGNLENVGFARRGSEGLYNVLMMEELHSIFAVGAGAVTKLIRTETGENGREKKFIERIFEPKYPYEYLSADTSNASMEAMDRFFAGR